MLIQQWRCTTEKANCYNSAFFCFVSASLFHQTAVFSSFLFLTSKRKNNNPSYLFLSQQPNRESIIGKLTWLAQLRNHSFTFHSDLLRKKKKNQSV